MLQADREPYSALALGWLSADFRGRLMIDPSHRIQWWNDAAQRAVTASHVVKELDGKLILDAPATARLNAFLSRLKTCSDTEILTLKDGDGHVALLGHYDAEAEMFCLEISSSHVEERALFADFRTIYGLTESESQAALALFRGKTVAEIALDRNVSIDTVRTQVRRMYGKIGAQSREKFFKMLLPFRIA
ncbi:helix-turn-helix transcriptional regulator [Sphingobium bisphenolivorans]|uniref:helix-turn-helix transcriptional regulator n=1 Tax=Sphingobium bisphenolivorans TaxID=1335760 RepID=UPI0003A1F6D3|nr:helix-turn-helix transcriptional regulator [Sphingobium bisphenolivorans]